MELFTAPSACTLPSTDQPFRVAEFDALFADHVKGLERIDATTLSLRFSADPGLDRTIADLAARESACCSFFSFSLDRNDGLSLRVSVPERYTDVLDGLQALAQKVGNLEAGASR